MELAARLSNQEKLAQDAYSETLAMDRRRREAEESLKLCQEQRDRMVKAFERMQEFHDCMEAQRKDEPLPEGHDDPDEACGDGVCYRVGEIIKAGIAASLPPAPIKFAGPEAVRARLFFDARMELLEAELAQAREEINLLKQTSAELCEVCGWAMCIPGEGCCNCGLERAREENRGFREPLRWLTMN